MLRGEAAPETTRVHDEDFYVTNDIELLTGRTVEALDVDTGRVRIDGDEQVPFSALVLATGAAPDASTSPEPTSPESTTSASVDDARRLGDAVRSGGRVAVIGAGWIGSEVAASARQMGAEVVLIDRAPVPLQRVLGHEIGEVFRSLHTDNGVQLRSETGVVELRGTGRVEQVVLSDGRDRSRRRGRRRHRCDPTGRPGRSGGLEGRRRDRGRRAPAIQRARRVRRGRRRLRLAPPLPATTAGRALGQRPQPGHHRRHQRRRRHRDLLRLPYFFSDQYDLGMEYVGYGRPSDTVVIRGDRAQREFVAFWQRDGVVTAAMNVNVWDVVEDLKAIVASGRVVDARRLADPDGPPARAGVPMTGCAYGGADSAGRVHPRGYEHGVDRRHATLAGHRLEERAASSSPTVRRGRSANGYVPRARRSRAAR